MARKQKDRIKKAIFFVCGLLATAVVLVPVYAALTGSLTPYAKLGRRFIYPTDFYVKNYIDIWSYMPIFRQFLSTCIYAVSVCAICSLVCLMSAYALSRYRMRAKSVFLNLLLLTQMVPIVIIMIPLYTLVRTLGLLNTYISVILLITAVAIAFPTWFLKAYLDTIPMELDDAAKIDGCSDLGALFRIVAPSVKPALFAVMAITFNLAWQRFLIPLVLLSDDVKYPLAVVAYRAMHIDPTPWQYVMTISIISIIPPLLVFFLTQRHFIRGLTAGMIK